MSDSAVRVTPLDIQRAQLMLRLGAALKKPIPGYVRQIAEAKPADEDNSQEGSSHS